MCRIIKKPVSALEVDILKPEIDWWSEICDEEKAEIEEGLAQADRGEIVSHEEVMSKYQKWRSK